MDIFFHHLLERSSKQHPEKNALIHKQGEWSYSELQQSCQRLAAGFAGLGVAKGERVGVFLPKQLETVQSFFAASMANGCFVPINPVLKAPQVQHIVNDCDVQVLVTSADRLKFLLPILADCPALKHIVLTDKILDVEIPQSQHLLMELDASTELTSPKTADDLAAILYTSGSTGKPKGVVLCHRNLVLGAHSVAQYLENHSDDVILAVLPLSFDYGLSQITTAFSVGATVVLLDYLLPKDVVKAVSKHKVTGLAAVPPLWQQLMKLTWPDEARQSIRYFTNSGGAMPAVTLSQLRDTFSNAKPFLMYGLTEAFRSTYLPPDMVDAKPGSMGKAIPNAQVMVVREDGSKCEPEEPGELVHRGPLVSLGYWNAPEKTAARFKPLPRNHAGIVLPELAVWSGDTVKKDAEGYLYFVGRRDEMIKTSGYRVSPMEVEEACYAANEHVAEAVVTGVADQELGQAIVLLVVLKTPDAISQETLNKAIKQQLPTFMHPKHIEIRDTLPRNPNGKLDRSLIAQQAKETYGHA